MASERNGMTEQNPQEETQNASFETQTSSADPMDESQGASMHATDSAPECADAENPPSADSRGVPLMPEGPIDYSPNRRNWRAGQDEFKREETPMPDEGASAPDSSDASHAQPNSASVNEADVFPRADAPVAPVAPVTPQAPVAPVAPTVNAPNSQPEQELTTPGTTKSSRKLSGGQKALYLFIGFCFGVFGLLGVFIYCNRRAKDISRAALNWTSVGVIIAVIINFAILFSGIDIYAMYEQYLDALGMHQSAEMFAEASPTAATDGIF